MAGLKPGVVGGSFNNYGFSDLGNGGFSINGSRPADENNITVDGATAIRTRSNGAIVGIQNVDAIQEVQVLTGDYMPEYGRVSGGQIRMVTKGGSNRFSGSGSLLPDATTTCRRTPGRATAARTRSRTAAPRRSTTSNAPIRLAARSVRRLKDKLFFFGAQEWVNYLGDSDQHGDCAHREDAHRRLQRAAGSANGFFTGARPIIAIRQTGRGVPGKHHPGEQAQLERHCDAERVPAPDAGIPAGHGKQRSSRATTRRTSGRTTSASTTVSTTRTRFSYPLRQVQLDGR